MCLPCLELVYGSTVDLFCTQEELEQHRLNLHPLRSQILFQAGDWHFAMADSFIRFVRGLFYFVRF